jgi:aerobic-type carbon monoxide dehydrogenase small subunit (CoxS/CutS family)
MDVSCTVNGQRVTLDGPPMRRLLDVLREALALTGTKEGCGEGECGACTVLMDGEPVLSCLVPIVQCEDWNIETIEHVSAQPGARTLIERMVSLGGVQCGACTPGIIVTAWALKERKSSVTPDDIRDALAGNLCRCTGYAGILRALLSAPESSGDRT